jgi:hypothetical protein
MLIPERLTRPDYNRDEEIRNDTSAEFPPLILIAAACYALVKLSRDCCRALHVIAMIILDNFRPLDFSWICSRFVVG